MISNHLAALVVGPASVLPRKLLGHQPLQVGGLAQAQQVGLALALQRQQDAFLAVARVAPDQRWAPALETLAQLVEQPAQRGLGVHAGRLLIRATRTSSTRHRLPTQKVCSRWLGRPGLAGL